jgi:colanic acid/amylovoran biosynthesis glycosyltransferase
MRVAYITGTFPSHTESFITREISGLCRSGFELVVFAASADGGPRAMASSVPVYYRPPRRSLDAVRSVLGLFATSPRCLLVLSRLLCTLLLANPREAITLLANLHTLGFFIRHMDREKIDHIHACFLSWPGCLGTALSLMTGRTLSISAHARDIFVEHGALEMKVRQASFVCVCTQQGMTRLKAMLPSKYHRKLHLVRHGIEPDGVQATGALSGHDEIADNPIVLAVGRLVPKKGFDVLLRAFALLVRDVPNAKLCLVGDGVERASLEALACQLDLTPCVRFLGWQSPDGVRSFMKRARVLVAPSRIDRHGDRDGLPNVVLEAFVCGIPVIASPLDGIREAVTHRKTGLLVEPGDIGGMASALGEILTDTSLRDHITSEARILAAGKFCPARNIRHLIPLFRSVDPCRLGA